MARNIQYSELVPLSGINPFKYNPKTGKNELRSKEDIDKQRSIVEAEIKLNRKILKGFKPPKKSKSKNNINKASGNKGK